MTVFAVIAPQANEQLQAAIERLYGDGRHYLVAPGQYLVHSAASTTNEFTESLGVSSGTLGRVLVVRVENYGGWHARSMWEWISSKINESPSPPSGVPCYWRPMTDGNRATRDEDTTSAPDDAGAAHGYFKSQRSNSTNERDVGPRHE